MVVVESCFFKNEAFLNAEGEDRGDGILSYKDVKGQKQGKSVTGKK